MVGCACCNCLMAASMVASLLEGGNDLLEAAADGGRRVAVEAAIAIAFALQQFIEVELAAEQAVQLGDLFRQFLLRLRWFLRHTPPARGHPERSVLARPPCPCDHLRTAPKFTTVTRQPQR